MGSNNFRYSVNNEFEEENRQSRTRLLPSDILLNKSLTKDDMQKLPFSNRSVSESRPHEMEARIKVSQSAAEETLRKLKDSALYTEEASDTNSLTDLHK